MNTKLIEEIANAVLYEGYMLYPYRPSAVKNKQRWNFGVVYSKGYSETQTGNDLWKMQTECLVIGTENTEITVKVRFLQAIARSIGEPSVPLSELPVDIGPEIRTVERLQVGDRILQPWQEASERDVMLRVCTLANLMSGGVTHCFTLPSRTELEPVHDTDGRIAGLIVRAQETVAGEVELAAQKVKEGVYKLILKVSNLTETSSSRQTSRDDALMQSMISTHAILRSREGEFVSLLDPPDEVRELAAGCENVGAWPVLVGEDGDRKAMLSSPIILYDYPQIAPESSGDLFDGTEIDEILALRILTLTDEEKREMRHSDGRAREILERTESLPEEQFLKLHGTLRGLRPAAEDKQ